MPATLQGWACVSCGTTFRSPPFGNRLPIRLFCAGSSYGNTRFRAVQLRQPLALPSCLVRLPNWPVCTYAAGNFTRVCERDNSVRLYTIAKLLERLEGPPGGVGDTVPSSQYQIDPLLLMSSGVLFAVAGGLGLAGFVDVQRDLV